MSEAQPIQLDHLLDVIASEGRHGRRRHGDRVNFALPPPPLRAAPKVSLLIESATIQLEVNDYRREEAWTLVDPQRVTVNMVRLERWFRRRGWVSADEVSLLQADLDAARRERAWLREQNNELREATGWSQDDAPALGGNRADL